MQGGLYPRLSAFYFFYFASLGALIPYWSLYLRALGFDGAAIGELIAILMGTKLVAPNVWGWIADRTGRRMPIIRSASLLSAILFSGVYLWHGYLGLALVMAGFSFFWNASLPQFEAVTLAHLGPRSHRYSIVRLWGSIGFILAVAGLAPVLERAGIDLLPAILLCLFLGIWASSLFVPEPAGPPHHEAHAPLRRILRRPEVVGLLAVCFLAQASHGAYYAFYTLYLEEHGYARTLVGQLWALGVIAEIGVFLVAHRWLPRFGARRLLLAALALTTLRWLLIGGFPDWLSLMLFAQTLHAASFGLYHASAISLVHHLFGARNQGMGQALYSSISFGAGGAAGSLLSGHLWASQPHALIYFSSAALALLGLLIAWRTVRDPASRSAQAA